jgi:hypothetical protein
MDNLMVIYRAMCKQEYENTLKNGVPDFCKRYKWFATNLNFIYNRVQDGKFNNSKFKQDAYKYVLCFEADISKADYVNINEIQFDRRRNPTIRLIGELSKNNLQY